MLEKNPGSSTAKERIARVVTLAGDANPNVAIPALTLLRQFAGADREVFRRLWSIATTGVGRRRQVALLSATAVLRDNAYPAIETAARSTEPALRATAAEALGYLTFAKASSLRATLAADRDPLVRGAVLASLRTAEGVTQNRALVLAALSDSDAGVAAAAIDALTRTGDPADLPAILDVVTKSASRREPDAAISAIAAAEKLRNDPRARAVVEAAYRNPNPVVSRIARRSLLLNFRAEPAAFPPVEYKASRSPADYVALLAEARKPWTARVETARGEFHVRLAGAAAPMTVMNFVTLARRNFFDGSAFHRVVPNFVDQDGDPTGTGNGGPGYEIRDDFANRAQRNVEAFLGPDQPLTVEVRDAAERARQVAFVDLRDDGLGDRAFQQRLGRVGGPGPFVRNSLEQQDFQDVLLFVRRRENRDSRSRTS